MPRLAVLLPKLLVLLVAPVFLGAQSPEPRELESAPDDGRLDARTAVPSSRSALVAPEFAAGLVLGVFANSTFRIQQGDGEGYADQWLGTDKVVHAAIAAGLASVGEHAGVDALAAAAMVCGAGAVFEYSQASNGGNPSTRDMWANCAGAALPVLWLTIRRAWQR